MKYFFLFLLSLALFACEKEEVAKKEQLPEANSAFIIGTTGGWGGGPAYKLENGQLFRSVANINLGGPEDIVNDADYQLMTDPDDVALVSDLLADYPEAVFSAQPTKFDCPEEALDGRCPYLIVVNENNSFRAWTRSSSDADSDAATYLDRVRTVTHALWE